MLAYDTSLAWAALLLLAIGLVMVYSASIAMAEISAHTGFRVPGTSSRGTALFLAVGAGSRPSLPSRCRCGAGSARALAVRRRRAAARARAGAGDRQVGQRFAALAVAGRRQRAAVRVHEARGRAVCGELRGAPRRVPARRAAAEADAAARLPAAVRGHGRHRRPAAARTGFRRIRRHRRHRLRHPVPGRTRLAAVRRTAAAAAAGALPRFSSPRRTVCSG